MTHTRHRDILHICFFLPFFFLFPSISFFLRGMKSYRKSVTWSAANSIPSSPHTQRGGQQSSALSPPRQRGTENENTEFKSHLLLASCVTPDLPLNLSGPRFFLGKLGALPLAWMLHRGPQHQDPSSRARASFPSRPCLVLPCQPRSLLG